MYDFVIHIKYIEKKDNLLNATEHVLNPQTFHIKIKFRNKGSLIKTACPAYGRAVFAWWHQGQGHNHALKEVL